MKDHIKIFVLIFMAILYLSSCFGQKTNKSEKFNEQLLGVWTKTNYNTYVLYNSLEFKKDGELIVGNLADTAIFYNYKLSKPFIYLTDHYHPTDTLTWKVTALSDSNLSFDKIGIDDGLWTYIKKKDK